MKKEQELTCEEHEEHEELEEIDDPYNYVWMCECGGISISIDGTYTKESAIELAKCLMELASY